MIEILPLLEWQYFDSNIRLRRHKKGTGNFFEVSRVQISSIEWDFKNKQKLTHWDYYPILNVLNDKSAKILEFKKGT